MPSSSEGSSGSSEVRRRFVETNRTGCSSGRFVEFVGPPSKKGPATNLPDEPTGISVMILTKIKSVGFVDELGRRAPSESKERETMADTEDPYYCPHCGVSPCAHLTEDCD